MGGARDREALTRNRESGVGNRESVTPLPRYPVTRGSENQLLMS
jgi:hypothetical protein